MHGHHQHEHSGHGDTRRIGFAFWLNACFTVIEFIGGWLTNSVAIMADAVHDLGDTLSLGLAWLLARLGHQPATQRYTYGFKRLSLLGAWINSIILVAGSVWILSEAIPRLMDPPMPHTEGMIGLAILGIIVNGVAAYRLHGGHSINEKVLNWHLIEDVMGWVAVLIVSIVLHFYRWPILDPLLSIGFTVFILINVGRYLVQTLRLFMQGVPDDIEQQALTAALLDVAHVDEIHHLHLWSLDGEQHVLTAHLVLNVNADGTLLKELKSQVNASLAPFNLAHTTIEFELPGEPCRDEGDALHTHSHNRPHVHQPVEPPE